MTDPDASSDLQPLFASHPRSWRENLYVYPVISRRSGGLSIGVNLNPDKACNFDCIYCQVDRNVPPTVRKVDPDRLRAELDATLRAAVTGKLYHTPPFDRVPESNRAIRDIAFSGDGEPTTCPQFLDAVQIAADLRRTLGLDDAGIVLITDAAYLHKPNVREALAIMDANNGEIWAKLDAGTEDYYRTINRPNVPLQTVLDNILDVARVRPIVVQSLWMSVKETPPPDEEVDAFANRLRDITDQDGHIKLVQVYTTARQTAEAYVAPLDPDQLDAIATRIKATAKVPVTTFSR